jgi:hypothetical protein
MAASPTVRARRDGGRKVPRQNNLRNKEKII